MLATRGCGGLFRVQYKYSFRDFLRKSFNLVGRMISAGLFLGLVKTYWKGSEGESVKNETARVLEVEVPPKTSSLPPADPATELPRIDCF